MLKPNRATSSLATAALLITGCNALGPGLSGPTEPTSGPAGAEHPGLQVYAEDACAHLGMDLARQLGKIDETLLTLGLTAGDVATWITDRDGPAGPHPDNTRWLKRRGDQRVAICAYAGSGVSAPRPPDVSAYDFVVVILPEDEEPIIDSFGHQQDGLSLPSA